MKRLAAIALLLPIVWLFALPVPPIQHSPWTTTTNDPTVTLQAQQPVSITTTNRTAALFHGGVNIDAVMIDPRNFGAAWNGVTDDTAAVQAALNAATNTVQGYVQFPAGTSVITGPLTVPGNVRVSGVSDKATVILHTGNNTLFQCIEPIATINARHFRNMMIFGNTGAAAGAFSLEGVSGCSISEVYIHYYPNGIGILLDNPAASTWTERTMLSHVHIDWCHIGICWLNYPYHADSVSMADPAIIGCHIDSGAGVPNAFGLYFGDHTVTYGGYINVKMNAWAEGFTGVYVAPTAIVQGNQVHLLMESLSFTNVHRFVMGANSTFLNQGEFAVTNPQITDSIPNNNTTHFGFGDFSGRFAWSRANEAVSGVTLFNSIRLVKTVTLTNEGPVMLMGGDANTNGVPGFFANFHLKCVSASHDHDIFLTASANYSEPLPSIVIPLDQAHWEQRLFGSSYIRYNSNTFGYPTLWINVTNMEGGNATLTVTADIYAPGFENFDILGPVPADLGDPYYCTRWRSGGGRTAGFFFGDGLTDSLYRPSGLTNYLQTDGVLRASPLLGQGSQGLQLWGNNTNANSNQVYAGFYTSDGLHRAGYIGKGDPTSTNFAVVSDIGPLNLFDSSGTGLSLTNGRAYTLSGISFSTANSYATLDLGGASPSILMEADGTASSSIGIFHHVSVARDYGWSLEVPNGAEDLLLSRRVANVDSRVMTFNSVNAQVDFAGLVNSTNGFASAGTIGSTASRAFVVPEYNGTNYSGTNWTFTIVGGIVNVSHSP